MFKTLKREYGGVQGIGGKAGKPARQVGLSILRSTTDQSNHVGLHCIQPNLRYFLK